MGLSSWCLSRKEEPDRRLVIEDGRIESNSGILRCAPYVIMNSISLV